MGDQTLSLRDAGDLINSSGLVDDVKKIDEADIGKREGRGSDTDYGDDSFDVDEQNDPNPNDSDGSDVDDEDYDDGEDDSSLDNVDEVPEGEVDEKNEKSQAVEFEIDIDGEKTKVTSDELIAGYQRNEEYSRKTTELADYSRNLQQGHTQIAKQYGERLRSVNGIVNTVRNMLIGDINSQEMQHLRATNPNQWAIERQHMQDRIDQVTGVLNQIQTEQQNHEQRVLQQQQQNLHDNVGLEATKLKQLVPGWDDNTKVALGEYLGKQGFSAQELAGVYDARMLSIAHKAKLYDDLMAKKKEPLRQKKKKLPKKISSGGGEIAKKTSKAANQWTSYSRLKSKAKKSGNMRDAGKAIAELLDL